MISDTHGYLDDNVFDHFKDCDEIWHGGDFGTLEVLKELRQFKPLRGVYGNIDGPEIRRIFPETTRFKCEEVEVLMTHIGGYPGKNSPLIKTELMNNPPELFICGHSHILKVI